MALTAVGCRSSGSGKDATDASDVPGDSTTGGGTNEAKGGNTKATGNPSGPPVVNFPGFEVMPDGRSVITVQVRGPVQISEQKVEGRIVYFLAGVSVPERVNRLPLVTQHFSTQVTSVTVEQAPGGANLLVDLREASPATFKISQNEAGNLITIVLPRSERWGSKNPEYDKNSYERPEKSDTVDQSESEGAPEDYEKETNRRRKKSKRQPKPYVERYLTLPKRTIAPDISITATGYGTRDQAVFLASGVRWGIIDQVEVELTPHSFRLAPNPAYVYPSIGMTAGYTQHAFEIGGRVRYFLGVDSDTGVTAGALLLGVPMAIHLGTWGRIDTGGFVTLDFESSIDLGGQSLSTPSTQSGIKAGLVNTGASPLYLDAGIPFYFLFQPVKEFWFGIHHGINILDFEDAANTFALPLGAEIGFTASNDFNPLADLGIKADLPLFIVPGRDGDVVEEKAYELGFWFRWYYYL